MRILSMIVLAVVSVVSFSPCLWAGDTAGLDLTVTFAVDKPPYWIMEPMDSSIGAGKPLAIEVLAKDPENASLVYDCSWWLNGVKQGLMVLPAGATFVLHDAITPNPELRWIVPATINLTDIHEFEFSASDSQFGSGNKIYKKIRVTIEKAPVISIEISSSTWSLSSVMLGGLRGNNGAHRITNTGDVPVVVDIGYGPVQDSIPPTTSSHLHSGVAQGVDTYITYAGSYLGGGIAIIPPHVGAGSGPTTLLKGTISQGGSYPLELTFGAPTALSAPVDGLNIGYEIRAYAV